jgi:hypothetical protein
MKFWGYSFYYRNGSARLTNQGECRLRVHPKSLEEYLVEKLKSAEDAM